MKNNSLKITILGLSLALVLGACGLEEAATDSNADATPSTVSDTTSDQETIFAATPYTSTSELTVDELFSLASPQDVLKQTKIFSVKRTYTGTGDDAFEGTVLKSTFTTASSGAYEINDIITYSDGYTVNNYCASDDSSFYQTYPDTSMVSDMEDGYVDQAITSPLLFVSKDTASLKEVREENGMYIAQIEDADGIKETITVDPVNRRIVSAVSMYPNSNGQDLTTCTQEFDYDNNQQLDRSAKENNTNESSENDNDSAASFDNSLFLGATDINGNAFSMNSFSSAKLIMLNYWEPWCGPCVGEMPDLQKLYEKYKDKGLVIVGVYSTFQQDDDAKAIIKDKNITYPILKMTDTLDTLSQDYVPASYFLDKNGNILTEEPYAGARSYTEWEEIIKNYLGE